MTRPGVGMKVVGILGGDAALDRVAGEADVALPVAKRRAGGDADLLAHEVDAADHLGDRMLYLQPRVHLDEGELAVLVQELRACRRCDSRALRSAAVAVAPSLSRAPALSAGDPASSSSF